MRYYDQPAVRRWLRLSRTVVMACLTLPTTAMALPPGLEPSTGRVETGSGANSDKPTSLITVKSASGAPGEPIPLTVTVRPGPKQSLAHTFLVGLPTGTRLSTNRDTAAATDEKTAIDVTRWDLSQLSVVISPTRAGTYTVAVVAASRPDNDGPMNFTTSTFTLKATAESRETVQAAGTPALGATVSRAEQADAAKVSEALRPPLAAPKPSNKPIQGDVTAKVETSNIEFNRPKTLVGLSHGETSRDYTTTATIAPRNLYAHSTLESGPAAASSALAAPLNSAIATTVSIVTPPSALKPVSTTEVNTKALVERAERLIQQGDISGARLVLERAADRGDPRATFLLAQTCDPRMLRTWKVQGLRPDPDRARALYAKAAQEGHHETGPIANTGR